ncbi:MAG: hypothetical protein ACREFI_15290 [Stellaceae bacterium]
MARWIRVGLALLVLAVDAVAFFGWPFAAPAALGSVAQVAVQLDLWLINNAAYPGLFLLGLIGVALLAFPELSAGIEWLRRQMEPPRLRVSGPYLHPEGAERHYRMIVTNAGGEIAANVKILLRGIAPKPRHAAWRAGYPYAMTWVSAAPGHEAAPCNIESEREETFEVIAGSPDAEGAVVCAGLDTKADRPEPVPIADDERWRLTYEVVADNARPVGFDLDASVEGKSLVVERKPERRKLRHHLDPRRLRR